MAMNYIKKYDKYLDTSLVSVKKVRLIRISDKCWPIICEYDGVEFPVFLLANTDQFVEKYAEAKYIERILAAYQGDHIQSIHIPMIYTMLVTDPNKLDIMYRLSVMFDQSINTKEAFVKATEEVLSALQHSGLSKCNHLIVYTTISGTLMHIELSPQYKIPDSAELAELIGCGL